MKKTFLIILNIAISISAFTQPISSKHYNKNWQLTEGDDKYYRRDIYKIHDSSFVIKDYYLNNKIEMIGHYKSIDKHLKDGLFIFYYGDGQKHYEGEYCNGIICGNWLIYEENGKVTNTINYDFEIPECQPFDTSINEYLKRDSLDYIVVDYMPRFCHKEFKNFADYVQASLFIPPLISKYKIRDNVEVEFTVDANGNLCDIDVKSYQMGKTINKEIIRILINSPKWTPALSNKYPVPMNYKMPIKIN